MSVGGEPVRMVCFDAGGVLVRICRSWAEGCVAAGVEHRWSAEAEANEALRHEANDAHQRGELECEAFFARVAETTAGLYRAEEIRAVHEAWIIEEYAGVREVICGLNDGGRVATGLLSNTNATHWAQRHMLGGRGVSAVGTVTHPHASHLLRLTKPGTEIYRAFEEATGVRGPGVLFFDDLAENVEAAKRAGWRAERIDHAGDTARQITEHLRRHGVRL